MYRGGLRHRWSRSWLRARRPMRPFNHVFEQKRFTCVSSLLSVLPVPTNHKDYSSAPFSMPVKLRPDLKLLYSLNFSSVQIISEEHVTTLQTSAASVISYLLRLLYVDISEQHTFPKQNTSDTEIDSWSGELSLQGYDALTANWRMMKTEKSGDTASLAVTRLRLSKDQYHARDLLTLEANWEAYRM
jgi:hypothetical protein